MVVRLLAALVAHFDFPAWCKGWRGPDRPRCSHLHPALPPGWSRFDDLLALRVRKLADWGPDADHLSLAGAAIKRLEGFACHFFLFLHEERMGCWRFGWFIRESCRFVGDDG